MILLIILTEYCLIFFISLLVLIIHIFRLITMAYHNRFPLDMLSGLD